MRSVALLLVLFACSAQQENAGTSRTTVKLSADSVAAAIDREADHLRQDTATVLGLSAEGARITSSYAGDTLRRLRVELLGETGRATNTFYFDSTLVFVVKSKIRYDAPMSGRVADSSATRYDLTTPAMPVPVADSLRAEARDLLAKMRKR